MGAHSGKPVETQRYAASYCDYEQQHVLLDHGETDEPVLWDLPAARVILRSTADPNCLFSTVSARVTERIIKSIVNDAYSLCSITIRQTAYTTVQARPTAGGLVAAVRNGDVLAISGVCLFTPHLVLRKRESQVLTVHCSLFTIHCSLLAAHYSLLTAHCSLFTAHCSLLTAHCSLFTADCSPLTVHCSLVAAHCSLLTAHCSLLTAHCSLLTAHCSLLTADCSLLTVQFPKGTALHAAVECRNTEIIERILANVNCVDETDQVRSVCNH